MPHDYKRNGVTTLFASLNVQDGTVLGPLHGPTMPTHKHPKVRAWLERHPRWVFHFTPTSASWINAVEGFFSTLTRRRLRRGVLQSVADLEQAIACYIREHNAASRPFVWTKPAEHHLRQAQPLACTFCLNQCTR